MNWTDGENETIPSLEEEEDDGPLCLYIPAMWHALCPDLFLSLFLSLSHTHTHTHTHAHTFLVSLTHNMSLLPHATLLRIFSPSPYWNAVFSHSHVVFSCSFSRCHSPFFSISLFLSRVASNFLLLYHHNVTFSVSVYLNFSLCPAVLPSQSSFYLSSSRSLQQTQTWTNFILCLESVSTSSLWSYYANTQTYSPRGKLASTTRHRRCHPRIKSPTSF